MHNAQQNLWKNISTQYILGIIDWIYRLNIYTWDMPFVYIISPNLPPNTSHQPYWLNNNIQEGDWEQKDENTNLFFTFWKMCTSAQSTPDLSI